RYSIASPKDFGFNSSKDTLCFFKGDDENASLKVTVASNNRLSINIKSWSADKCEWTQSSTALISTEYILSDLAGNKAYSILINNKPLKKITSDKNGSITFESTASAKPVDIMVVPE
ncbi:MAG: hypothetical protein ACTHLB_04245, partial [Parafilimonas sp.]